MISPFQIFWVLSPEKKTPPSPLPAISQDWYHKSGPQKHCSSFGGAQGRGRNGGEASRRFSLRLFAELTAHDIRSSCLRMPPQDDRPIGTVYEDKGPKPERGR
jgi:hypothetical protein